MTLGGGERAFVASMTGVEKGLAGVHGRLSGMDQGQDNRDIHMVVVGAMVKPRRSVWLGASGYMVGQASIIIVVPH